jgi:hypothetical protein
MKGRILKVVKKNNWIQGIYKSPQSPRLQKFRSSWELNLFQFLDECNNVNSWESEIVAIPYKYGNKWRRYYPDLLINHKLLIEVKPAGQIATPMNVAKFKAAQLFCKSKGWTFMIVTKEILANKRLLMEQFSK